MIPKGVKNYCCEDLSLIENYEQALNDKTQTYVCHHKLEIELGLSRAELIAAELYWNRPASELIFLTRAEHARVHREGKHHTKETTAKQSKALKGKNSSSAKSVYQIDKTTGEIIKRWDCIREVTRVLGIESTHISACCMGKAKSTGGFKWKYV